MKTLILKDRYLKEIKAVLILQKNIVNDILNNARLNKKDKNLYENVIKRVDFLLKVIEEGEQ